MLKRRKKLYSICESETNVSDTWWYAMINFTLGSEDSMVNNLLWIIWRVGKNEIILGKSRVCDGINTELYVFVKKIRFTKYVWWYASYAYV